MKTLVLTGYDEAFAELGELTSPLIEEYAKRHGFECARMREYIMSNRLHNLHPSWWKMAFVSTEGFRNYQRFIWIDADIVITNPNIVPPGESGYHCSRDWGVDAIEPWMLSNCCWTAFPDSLPLIRWILANRENYSCEFHEQNHMREAAKGPFKETITVHPRRVFNAVPIEIHASAPEPWQPGDWCAHLTMVSLPERMRLFHEIKRQAGL